MEEKFLAAPLDRAAWRRTIATLAALSAFLILILLVRQIMPLITILVLPVLLAPALSYSSAPIGYRLTDRELTIDRKTLWSVRVPLSQIAACYPLPQSTLHDAIRVYGTGGLFGWAGRYRSPELGPFTMHATNLDRLVLIRRRRGKPIAISPAKTEEFIRGLQRQYETIETAPIRGRRIPR
jgi:hypothetical protein